jgi:predicted DNA-binding transcriptional regulator AlpA
MSNNEKNGQQPKVIYQLETDDLEQIINNAVTAAMERYTSTTTPTRDANNDSDELMTVQQVSQYLHRSRSTLWRYEQLGILKPIRVGRSVYFSRSDVLSILNKII